MRSDMGIDPGEKAGRQQSRKEIYFGPNPTNLTQERALWPLPLTSVHPRPLTDRQPVSSTAHSWDGRDAVKVPHLRQLTLSRRERGAVPCTPALPRASPLL